MSRAEFWLRPEVALDAPCSSRFQESLDSCLRRNDRVRSMQITIL